MSFCDHVHRPLLTALAALALSCSSSSDGPDTEPDTDAEPDAMAEPDAEHEPAGEAEADEESTSPEPESEPEAEPLPWGDGPRAVSGQAYFFDMPTLGEIVQMTEVEGAEVYVLEAPELRMTLQPADSHAFRLEGIPEGAEVTLALEHEDYYPTLTATLPVAGEDLAGLTFQMLTNDLVALGNSLVGVEDPFDPALCGMATTVTAIHEHQHTVWAVGEPGATVALDPPVPPETGPFYFNEMVLPEKRLTETSKDGGVLVIGCPHGTYTWTGYKEGLEFRTLKLRCVPGFATNASPPWGLQVLGPE